MIMKFRPHLAALLILAYLTSGCIFSPGGDNKETPPPPPIDTCAKERDALIELFRTVYAARNLDAYREILSEDYLFIPLPPDEPYNYDIEIQIAERMFNGLEGNNSTIISTISVDQLDAQGTWQPTPENDPNFGQAQHEGAPASFKRNYLIDIKFSVSGQDLILRVQGSVNFYVTDEGGCYKILGLEDLTVGTP
jgi:hypothetical protein